jgi:hypothetical protein
LGRIDFYFDDDTAVISKGKSIVVWLLGHNHIFVQGEKSQYIESHG